MPSEAHRDLAQKSVLPNLALLCQKGGFRAPLGVVGRGVAGEIQNAIRALCKPYGEAQTAIKKDVREKVRATLRSLRESLTDEQLAHDVFYRYKRAKATIAFLQRSTGNTLIHEWEKVHNIYRWNPLRHGKRVTVEQRLEILLPKRESIAQYNLMTCPIREERDTLLRFINDQGLREPEGKLYPSTRGQRLRGTVVHVASGFVPVVGEKQDLDLLFDRRAPAHERVLAAGSLVLSIVTIGTSPNASSVLKGAHGLTYEVRYVDNLDELAEGTAVVADNVRYVDNLDELTSSRRGVGVLENQAGKQLDKAAELGQDAARSVATGIVRAGGWKEIARNPGDALDIQSAFSGKPIKYRNGKAFIEEFELDGVHFDRVKDGVLGEVKGNYDFATRLAQAGKLEFLDDLIKEAQRQTRVARKLGLPLEWHVRRQDLQGFKNTIGAQFSEIRFVPYDP